jgi:hypothetical protein
MNFMSGEILDGRRIRLLTIVVNFAREKVEPWRQDYKGNAPMARRGTLKLLQD